jgi:hypothetical protein
VDGTGEDRGEAPKNGDVCWEKNGGFLRKTMGFIRKYGDFLEKSPGIEHDLIIINDGFSFKK